MDACVSEVMYKSHSAELYSAMMLLATSIQQGKSVAGTVKREQFSQCFCSSVFVNNCWSDKIFFWKTAEI